MLRRSTRILLEVVIGLMAAVALLVGVSLWRLSEGPLRVDVLTPYLEQALGGGDQGASVEIGETVLIWPDWSRTLDLRARQVRLRDANGFNIATLPAVSVNLSLRALVQGVVAPTEVEVIGARVNLLRWSDGSFDFGLDQVGVEAAEVEDDADLSVVVPDLLRELLSEPSPARPLSFLNAVRILNGSLTIIDRKLNTVWRAPTAAIEVRRDPSGLAGEMHLALEAGPEIAQVEAAFRHDSDTEASTVTARFANLRLEALASLVPSLTPAEGLRIPIDGSLAAELGSDGGVRFLTFDVSGGTGSLSLPELLAEPLPIEGLSIRGQMDGVEQRLEIDDASLRLGSGRPAAQGGGPVLALNGSASLREGDLRVEVETRASDVGAEQLHLYWPTPIAAKARAWVTENIPAGWLDDAWLKASLRIPGGDFSATVAEALSGGYRFRDLEVHYNRPMPPVVGVSGSSDFDQTRMTIEPLGGVLGDLKIAEADIEIFDFDKENQMIDIGILVEGPLSSMLELLDHEALRLVSPLGIDPAHTAGEAAVVAGFRMPLVRDLTYDRMEITAEAELEKVSVRDAVLNRSASNGHLMLNLDKTGMIVAGPVELAGVPIDLDWREHFTEGDGPRSVFVMKIGTLSQADRQALGLDMAPYLNGPVSASLLVALFPDHSGTLEAVMSLDQASLSIPFLNWEKPPADPGQLRVVLKLTNDEISDLEEIEVSAGSLLARGEGHFEEDGVARLELEAFAWGQSRLTDVILVLGRDQVAVTAGGGVFDALPFIGKGGDPARDGSDGGEGSLPVFTFSAPRLDAITFGKGRQLEEVAVALDRGADGWRLMSVDAKLPRALWSDTLEAEDAVDSARPARRRGAEVGDEEAEPPPSLAKPKKLAKQQARERTFDLDYRASSRGGYALEVATADLGAFLRAVNLRDTIRGGRLRIKGTSAGPIPAHTLAARIEADDYVMVGAPILARMLSVASLTGMLDTLGGNGIRFDRLISDFTLTDGVAQTDLLRAYGSAIGITAKGGIDFNTAQVDLEGTLVPAYTVNRIIGAIPLLGPLLTGGEGEGLLGFVYHMEGDLDDPKVSVNPLSALAPGFLRGLFSGLDGDEATVYPTGPER
jgi:hypothetical protein